MIKIKKGLLIDKNVFCVSYLYFNLQSDHKIYLSRYYSQNLFFHSTLKLHSHLFRLGKIDTSTPQYCRY